MPTTPSELEAPSNPPPAMNPVPMATQPTSGPPAASSMPRSSRWLPRRGLRSLSIHGVLLAGVAAFLFPFLWMLSTSVKTDEELSQASILPGLPTFLDASPYVRAMPEPAKPFDAPEEVWREALPELLAAAEAKIAQVQGADRGAAAATVDATAHRAAAARVLVDQTVTRLNRRLWDGPRESLLLAFTAELTDGGAAGALAEALARLELMQVSLRTLDLRAINLHGGASIAQAMQVESGDAELVPVGDATLVRYHFEGTSSPPVVLRYAFEMPAGVTMEQIHKLTVAIKADDSWHTVDATLDVEGQRWVSQRTTPLAQHRAMSITFQPPTFDDETDRAKTWVPIHVAGPAPASPEGASASPARAVLRLILYPSSTREAVTQKVVRNYERAFFAVPFWRYVVNSFLLVGLTVGGALFSSAFVAYAFARLHWPGRGVAFGLLLSTMMLPGQVTMIPSFMIWRELGWYNTLNPLWVPAWFGGAFFIFLMVQHMKTIPRELEEAARIDGLNAVQSWWYVILPQVRPSMAAIAILSFMGAWNEFMGPLIYLRDQAKFPLALGLFGMRIDQGGDWTMMMAGNVLMTIPIIVIFFLFQRYFVQGMTMTGMKG